jgi:predicted permease
MSNIVLLFVCLCVCFLLDRRRWLPPEAPAVLNGFIVFVSLPALILLHVHDIQLQPELLMVGFGITLSYLTLPGWRYVPGAV